MTIPASPEAWRSQVIAQIESGMNMREWAAKHGVPYGRLSSQARSLFGREPELFALTKRLCPCPLMAKLLPYKDPRIREYLKRVWFEIEALSGEGSSDSQRISVFCAIKCHLDVGATAEDVNLEFLREVGRGTGRSMRLRSAVLAALSSGVHDDDPFFSWAVDNEERIRAYDAAGSKLRDLIEDEGYRRARFVRCYSSGGKGQTAASLFFFDTADEFCSSLLDGFIARREGRLLSDDRLFFAHFVESLGFVPERLGDFTVDTFGRQLEWFKESLPGKTACPLRLTRLFYMYLIDLQPDQDAFTFETGLPPKALGYSCIVKMWLRGYRAVVYEPLDPAPAFSKWLLYPNENESIKATFRTDTPKAVNCSVPDPRLERLLIDWIWSGGLGSFSVRVAPAQVRVLLGKVAEEGLSLVDGNAAKPVVSARCVAAAVAELAKTNQRNIFEIKARLRAFLSFSEKRGALSVEPACFLLLENAHGDTSGGSGAKADAVTAEDLSALARELERTSDRSVDDELTYIAFITQALTQLRFSEVLSLRVRDLDASRSGEFDAVRVCRKSGGYDYELVEVPREVHRMLKAAVAITEPVRARADESIAGYVFLVDGQMGMERVLSKSSCDKRFASACERLGIKLITASDVRRTYETTVILEGAKRNWSRMVLRKVTGHADVKSDEPYITLDVMSSETRRYLEGAFVVEIGSPRIRGEVLPDAEVPDDLAALVEGGAGVCRNAECRIAGTLPCLECPGFATAPRFIPEMLEAIAILDEQLAAAQPHEREHLLVAKKKYLTYLGKMVDMREGRTP